VNTDNYSHRPLARHSSSPAPSSHGFRTFNNTYAHLFLPPRVIHTGCLYTFTPLALLLLHLHSPVPSPSRQRLAPPRWSFYSPA
jgi:hypothetical protein